MKYDPFSLKGNGTLDGTILSVMILVISLLRRRAFFRGEGGWGLGVGGGGERKDYATSPEVALPPCFPPIL